jgi:hypothetical protein
MDFRVAMLPGFGGGHVHDLAGTAWNTFRVLIKSLVPFLPEITTYP